MSSKAWKEHEKNTAKALGGKRIVRQSYYESAPDVVHDLGFIIECKYRKTFVARKWYEQAKGYCKKDNIPLLVVKEHNQRGALVLLSLDDFRSLINGISRQDKKQSV